MCSSDLHTYRGSEDGVLLSFDGAPIKLNISGDNIQKFSDDLYRAIDGENLISVFCRMYSPFSQPMQSYKINFNSPTGR